MLRRMTTNRGFTLIELVMTLVMGIIVLSAAVSFAMSTFRTVEGNTIRDEVYRNARFIAMSLERDLQTTGVGIASTPSFGTLSVWGDSIVILGVPYEPNESPPYDIDPPAGTNNPLAPDGTCGVRCIDLLDPNKDFNIKAGELARLQVNDERRLILVESVTGGATSKSVWWTSAPSILRYESGLSGGLLLDRFSTFVQKLTPIIYYVDGEKLMRAQNFNMDATPAGEVLAYGVQSWKVSLIFTDGDALPEADGNDSDLTNNFDDIIAVLIQATLAADRPHPAVNAGNIFTRDYEWTFAPRNLMYERNR